MSLTKREKIMLLLLVIVGIGFGYYYFFMQHQLDDIEELNDSISNQNRMIQTYNTTKKSIKTLESNIEKEEEALYVAFEPYLKHLNQEEIILLMNEIIMRSNVVVESIGFEDFDLGELLSLNYEIMNVNINVSGSYKDVLAFVSSFWRFDHNIFVSSVSLSEMDNVEGESLLSGDLSVAFVRVNNEYASDVTLFEWYNDSIYEKEDPFDDTDFSVFFNPNYFYTGTDVEFYNPPFEGFNDVIGHWAEEVINFFGRNGYILGDEDNNVNPDSNMTRLETVVLLDLVFRWELNDDLVSLEGFDDYDQISELDDIEKKTLLKAYNSGYLFGYDDNTLRPYNAITYEELGYIGANLLSDDNINWNMVAAELKDQLGYESPGLENDQLLATKAEIIYFLAYIDQQL
jgi:Tfp pilus assembly protein PilO